MYGQELDKTFVERSPAAPIPSAFSKGGGNGVPLPGSRPVVGQTRLGSNVITEIIGEGGMATVYKVWNERLEVFRAVKLLSQEAFSARFETEAKITAKLHHEGIVEIHNIGEWNGLPYMEMEFVDGSDLQKTLDKRGRLPEVVCVAIATLVAEALAHAHTKTFTLVGKQYCGIIHRDLKPANIMISNQGAVKLTDFGIARPTQASLHTMDGNIVGTMHYLSPEQMGGGEVDNRSDIYSFGAILYEMITGTKTFPQESIAELMMQKSVNKFKSLDEYDIPINADLVKIIHRCLKITPDKRYQRTQDLVDDLKKLNESLTKQALTEVVKNYLDGKDELAFTNPGQTKTLWIVNKLKRPEVSDKTKIPELPAEQEPSETPDRPKTMVTAKKPIMEWDSAKSRRMIIIVPLLLAAAFSISYIAIRIITAKSPAAAVNKPISVDTASIRKMESDTVAASPGTPDVLKAKTPAAAPRPQPSTAPAAQAKPATPARQAAAPAWPEPSEPVAATPAASPDDALFFIEEGKKFLAQNKPHEALANFQRALRTQSSVPRQQIVSQSLYGSAQSNTILYRRGSIPRSNFEAAWRAVKNAHAAGTPEYMESMAQLEEKE